MSAENDLQQQTERPARRRRFNPATAAGAGLGFIAAVAAVAAFQMWGSYAESQPPCPADGSLFSFMPGQPARASEVNCNFSNLDGRLAAVESAVLFVTTPSCPPGYIAYAAGQGRYLVGAPGAGPTGGTVGTALTSLENRPVGQHAHTATSPPHLHSITDVQHDHTYTTSNSDASGPYSDYGNNSYFGHARTHPAYSGITGTNAATALVTVDNSGAVAGTPAPYIQLRVCVRAP